MAGNPNINKGIPKQKVLSKNSSKKKRKFSDYYTIALAVVIVLIIIAGVINENAPKNYYLKDIKILECSVTQKTEEDGKYYIRVSVGNTFSLSEDNSWVEVNSDFYNKQIYDSKIGVKFANTDVYSKKYWGLFGDKGQTFESNSWSIEDIYPSLDEANKANPTKNYTSQASIQKKKITQKGDHFFVVNIDQKSMPVMVEEEIYNKYNVNDKINCEFESIGEVTRFIKLTK